MIRIAHLLGVVRVVVGALAPVEGAAALAADDVFLSNAKALERFELAPILLLGLAFIVVAEEFFASLNVAKGGKCDIPDAGYLLLQPLGLEIVADASVVDADAVDEPPGGALEVFLTPQAVDENFACLLVGDIGTKLVRQWPLKSFSINNIPPVQKQTGVFLDRAGRSHAAALGHRPLNEDTGLGVVVLDSVNDGLHSFLKDFQLIFEHRHCLFLQALFELVQRRSWHFAVGCAGEDYVLYTS
jgi:hypothetical protein